MLGQPLGSALTRLLLVLLAFTAVGCARDRDSDRRETAGGDVVGETAVRVSEVELGRSIGSDNRVVSQTDEFAPADTIYASIVTEGSGANATLAVRWTFEDDQVVDESTRTISATGRDVTEFHIARPSGWPAGQYTLRVLLDGREVETKTFRVS